MAQVTADVGKVVTAEGGAEDGGRAVDASQFLVSRCSFPGYSPY